MRVTVLEIWLYAPWVHSLKEKRMEIKSLLHKLRHRFNVSACEAAEQDVHQTLVIGVAYLSPGTAQADSARQRILDFLEAGSEAEIVEVQRQDY